MHELSLCESIYGIADRARQGRTVETIHIEAGEFRQVVPETLERCWALVTDGTDLNGSNLQVDVVPGADLFVTALDLRTTDRG